MPVVHRLGAAGAVLGVVESGGAEPGVVYAKAAFRGRLQADVARRVVARLSEPTAATAFERYGFIVLARSH